MRRVVLALLVLLAGATIIDGTSATAAGSEQWAVHSPSGDVTAQLRRTADGALALAVRHRGSPVLAPSPLGITTADSAYTDGLDLVAHRRTFVDDTYRTVIGKRRDHHAVAWQETFWFATADGDRIGLVLRVADDGVAYRYVLPTSGRIAVVDESSGFVLPDATEAWLSPYSVSYASRPFEATVEDAPEQQYGYPALFRTSAGSYVLVTEADVDGRYGGTRLTLDEGRFDVTLPQAEVSSTGPLRTPWRVAIVGGLDDVVESDLVQDLAPPSMLDGTDWVRPGVAAWSWWSDSGSPHDLERQQEYVDYAQRHGWEYVLVDEGWDPAWMPELIQYAAAREIGVWVWSHWEDLATQEQRDRLLSRWRSWGAVGVKVDFMNSDSQERMRWYDAFLRDTARQRLMVNFHGATLPRGIERTWPHVVTVEAVAGAELYKIDPTRIGPDVNATYPFTRNVVGTVDYTPVTFSAESRDTSDGHELALSVVLESGLQHFADAPESYATRPLAQDWLDAVPTVWDDTRLLSGEPGESAVLARRSGPAWYLGGLVAGPARTVPFELDMLGSRPYLLELFRDGGDGGLVRDRQLVTSGDRLRVPVADNGGFAARICPYSPGVRTCGRVVTDATMEARPDAVLTGRGQHVEVSGTFTAPTDGPVRRVRLDAVVPETWSAVAVSGRTQAPVLEPGQTLRATWRVTVPDDANLGSYEVVTRAHFDASGADPRRLLVDATEVVAPPPGFYDVEAEATDRLTVSWIYRGAATGFVEHRVAGTDSWTRTDASFDGVRHHAAVGPFRDGLVDLEYRLGVMTPDGGVDHGPVATVQLLRPEAVTVVDNEDPGYQQSGPWRGSSLTGWDGSGTVYAGTTGATATWQANVDPGLYDVAVWFPSHSSNTRSASYLITHADGTTAVEVDQLAAGGDWHSLGRYRPTADGQLAVTLTVSSGGFTRADAARFVRVTD